MFRTGSRLSVLICLALGLVATSAWAERELHVLSIRKGWVAPLDFLAPPTAHVVVDRPGAQVVLVLLDDGAVRWQVDLAEGTRIETILRNGRATSESRVFLKGAPFDIPPDPTLRVVSQPFGSVFRDLQRRLAELTGLDRVSSFRASYKAGPAAYRVDQAAGDDAVLALGYLDEQKINLNGLPPPILDELQRDSAAIRTRAVFDTDGIVLFRGGGAERFPVPEDLAPPFLPSRAFYDDSEQVIYGLSYGGEGHIYRIDTQSGAWSILFDLAGFDGAALLFDPKTERFVVTGAFFRPGDIRVLDRTGQGRTTKIELRRFPGFTDLFDYPKAAPPNLIPRVYAQDWVLLDATSDALSGAQSAYRAYAVNLMTEEVRLVAYRDP